MKNRIDQKDAVAFMKGGKARFVLHTLKTDRQFRYKINLRGRAQDIADDLWWIFVVGVATEQETYIGLITAKNRMILRDQLPKEVQPAAKLLQYCWDKLQTLEVPERLLIFHLGACGICGRPLKDAKSLAIGIGPECLKRIG